MDKKINAWLYDILNSIDEIESFFEGKPKFFWNIKKIFRPKEQLKGILKSLERQ